MRISAETYTKAPQTEN